MQKLDQALIRALARGEPRSTLALAAALSAARHGDLRAVQAGRSSCVMVRFSPMIWRGYPVLVDEADAQALASVIEATPVVSLDGHPDDVDPLVPYMTRVGETARFRSVLAPADQLSWAPSGPTTRVATPLDLDALDDLFADYEVRFISGARSRRRYLQRCIARQGAVVHEGHHGIDGAALTSGMTPRFLVFDHIRVAPRSRGQQISWALVSRIVEIAQAYGVGLCIGSVAQDNPMSMPEQQGWMQVHASANLRLRDRVPGERPIRRLALRLSHHIGI